MTETAETVRRLSWRGILAPMALRETDLYPPIKAILVRQGYRVKGEVVDCDVVAVRKERPAANRWIGRFSRPVGSDLPGEDVIQSHHWPRMEPAGAKQAPFEAPSWPRPLVVRRSTGPSVATTRRRGAPV